MSDNQTDFPKLRRNFDEWSIAQRKQLLMDRAYGSTVEMFLEQACLLTGAAGSRFVVRQEAAAVTPLFVRETFCQVDIRSFLEKLE